MICNWGVLGPGFVASRAVIPAIQTSHNGRVRALASRNPERARVLAGQWQIERIYGDYQELLDDPTIDAVYIALPNHLHCTWTIQAARAGKHVLCEKPLACSAREGEEMLAACEQAQVQLMEAVMYRFHPRSQRLRQLAYDGELGELRFLHSSFTFTLADPLTYRHSLTYGGGALLDVGCYCINALCWLGDATPVELQSFVFHGADSGIDLAVSAHMRFVCGTLGHMQCSFDATEHQSLEIIGSAGTATADLAFTAWRDDTTTLRLQRGSQITHERFAPTDPYQLMVEHFASVIQREMPLMYSPQEAIQVLSVLDTIRAQW